MRILLQILLIDNRICNWFDSFRMQDDTNAEYVFNKTSVMIHVPCLSFFTRAHYAVARKMSVCVCQNVYFTAGSHTTLVCPY